jgi:type I restriction enzyme, S subunit
MKHAQKTNRTWEMTTLTEIANLNPKESLSKNAKATYVAMERLYPSQRRISGFDVKAFAGGMKFRNGDTLVARITPCLENGKTALVDCLQDGEVGFGSTEFIVLRPKQNRSDSKFLYYFSISPEFRVTAIKSMTGTSGRQRVQTDLVAQKKFQFPLQPEQRAIAAVLSSLDDKIELLQRQNNTLEQIAQTIFKEWFIEFNFPDKNGKPYKANGGKMVDSDLGKIPEGWRVEPVGKTVRCVGGSTPSTKENSYWSGGINPFVTPKDLSSLMSPFIYKSERCITDAGVNEISSGQIPAGTILLSSRAPIGYLAFAGMPVSINQGIIAMICDGVLPKEYIFLWVQSNMKQIKGNASGTTFDEISKSNFRPLPAIVPNEPILAEYVHAVEATYNKISSNVRQCETLAKLRDNLLPKLMSGQLWVKE